MATEPDEVEEKKVKALDADDIAMLKTYGTSHYARMIKNAQGDIERIMKHVNELIGIKESDTGLGPPSTWDLVGDKQMLSEQPLQVARCTKIINDPDQTKYVINIKQIAKFVVGLGDKVSPTDIEEGMRVGYDALWHISSSFFLSFAE